ncbi:MAG TPA: class I SAM-dependent methyltransferase [Planctomycetota bacterium]|nr:class I SAM-dependent methyltransferase [Planctomycetota bacterium]
MARSRPISTAPFWRRSRGDDFLAACYRTTPPAIARSFEVEEAFVREHLPRRGRVLEVGCGAGRFLARLGDRGSRAFGCDLAVAALAKAREVLAGSVPLCAADAGALPFRDAAFDGVLCIQASLGNFGDRIEAALREMRRVLWPDGALLATVYSETALPDRLEWYRRLEGHDRFGRIDGARSRGHLVVTTTGWASEGFDGEGLESLFRASGFDARLERRDPILYLIRATPTGSREPNPRRGRAARSRG